MRFSRKFLRRVWNTPFEIRARWRDRRLSKTPHRYLSIGAIFKNEAPYLDEWLTFHLGVGAEHFYLYDNGSTDNYLSVLKPYLDGGFVTLIDWPQRSSQLSAYRHCARTFGNSNHWIAYFDLDEFLFSPVQVDIRPILRTCENQVSVLVTSFFFGSSGHQTRPAGTQVEVFTRRGYEKSVKSISNPRWIRVLHSPHRFNYFGDKEYPDFTAPRDLLRINHYWSRSMEDLQLKLQRGRANTLIDDRNWQECVERNASLNAVEDVCALDIANAVRAKGQEIFRAGARRRSVHS